MVPGRLRRRSAWGRSLGSRAVSPGPGLIDVFWVGTGSALWVDRYNGGWSGAAPLDSGTVTGNPVV